MWLDDLWLICATELGRLGKRSFSSVSVAEAFYFFLSTVLGGRLELNLSWFFLLCLSKAFTIWCFVDGALAVFVLYFGVCWLDILWLIFSHEVGRVETVL